jgi:Na+/H+ antiporter NhaC
MNEMCAPLNLRWPDHIKNDLILFLTLLFLFYFIFFFLQHGRKTKHKNVNSDAVVSSVEIKFKSQLDMLQNGGAKDDAVSENL